MRDIKYNIKLHISIFIHISKYRDWIIIM